MATNPNEPAYPCSAEIAAADLGTGMYVSGLTKLEYFTALAMQGFIAGFKVGLTGISLEQMGKELRALPGASVAIANAVIAELNKTHGGKL